MKVMKKMSNLLHKNVVLSFFVSLFFALTLFVFGSAHIYYTNVLEFPFTYLDIFMRIMLLVVVVTLSMTIIMTLLFESAHKKSISIIFIISFLLWFQGNILVWNYGPLDGREIVWGNYKYYGYIDGLIWGICILFAVFKSKIVYKFALRLSIVFIIIQLSSIGIAYYKSPKPSFKDYVLDESRKFTFSKKKNVIILVIDSFQSDIFQELINENSDYSTTLDGFTYFRNALAGFARTYASAPLILTSQYYDNTIPMQKFIQKAFSDESIPKLLKDNKFRVDMFPCRMKTIYLDENQASNFIKRSASKNIHHNWLFLIDLSFFRHLPHFFKKYIHSNESWFLSRIFYSEKAEILSGKEPESEINTQKKYKPKDLVFVEKLVAYADLTDDKVFKFYHLEGIHPPFILNENLEFERMKANRNSMKRQAKGMMKLVDIFLKKLYQLGVYNSSYIFIIGDHGSAEYSMGVNFSSIGRKSPEISPSIPADVKASALPLILVKPFNQKGMLKISDAPVSLSDIPQTVAAELSFKADFSGKSIFEIEENETRTRRFLFYDLHRIDNSWDRAYLPTMQEYLISGYSWFDKSWKASRKFRQPEKKAVSVESYNYGDIIDFSANGNTAPYRTSGWFDQEGSFIWTIGKNATLVIPLKKQPEESLIMTATIRPHLAGGKVPHQLVNIYVNGKKAGKWIVKSKGKYRLLIPGGLLDGKSLKIRYEIPGLVSPMEGPRRLGLAFYSLAFHEAPAYSMGQNLLFKKGGNAGQFLMNGWSHQERRYIWTIGKNATLVIPLKKQPEEGLIMTATIRPHLAGGKVPHQRVNIYVNGKKAGKWIVKSKGKYRLLIPRSLMDGKSIKIRYNIPSAASPMEGPKRLGLAFYSLAFHEAPVDSIK